MENFRPLEALVLRLADGEYDEVLPQGQAPVKPNVQNIVALTRFAEGDTKLSNTRTEIKLLSRSVLYSEMTYEEAAFNANLIPALRLKIGRAHV